MSIDANIVGITNLPDGTARIYMEQPDRTRCAGQSLMIVENPPANLGALFGRSVWGGDSCLMVGEIEVARRVGYTRLKVNSSALDRLCGR